MNKEEVFYHGTDADLLPGDIVEPGEDGVSWAAREPWYATRRAVVRAQYNRGQANLKNESYEGHPRIYTVTPLGDIEDTHKPGMLIDPKTEGVHVTSKDGFMVTGEYTPDIKEFNENVIKGTVRYRAEKGMPPLSEAQMDPTKVNFF